jgi:hypothetical protein
VAVDATVGCVEPSLQVPEVVIADTWKVSVGLTVRERVFPVVTVNPSSAESTLVPVQTPAEAGPVQLEKFIQYPDVVVATEEFTIPSAWIVPEALGVVPVEYWKATVPLTGLVATAQCAVVI